MENSRNFLITIALSVLILTVWQLFYMNPRIEAERERELARVESEQRQVQPGEAADLPQPGDASAPAGQPAIPGGGTALPTAEGRDAALAASQRVRIDTPRLSGSINLVGARVDDLVLNDYRVTVEPNSPNIELLNPSTLSDGYYAEIGYTGAQQANSLPGPQTEWTAEQGAVLTPDTPVTLTYANDDGLTFQRTIAVDDNYLFTYSDEVINEGGEAVSIYNYGRVTRIGMPDIEGFFILHEGLIGVTGDEGLQEIKYSRLRDDRQIQPSRSVDGWFGITDKYWAVTLIPRSGESFQPRYAFLDDGRERFQVDFLTDAIAIAPGQSVTVENMVFAGAKEVQVIDAYEAQHNIRQFEMLIDWGWFYFITKPLFYVIDWLFRLLGNFGLAILATTVLVKAIFFPLANKSYVSMANMKKVQPKMLEIREKYADDKMKQQQAMMELYKTEKINPLAGCWPILIQIPVFFALYKVLYVTIEMRHAPFFGWIRDLAAPDPTTVFNLFGLLPYDVPSFLMVGVWPIIMGITMFLQMRMNPTPPDPTQAMIFNWMPVVFTFLLATFPAGLVIYWAWNNFLSILQQGIIMKRQGARIELWDNLTGLFKKKPKQPAE
ncbi:membrane protein insertase YidC [Chelativorans sp. ZYF759]|uniref:membrane protein insertase YidC n=1 Tax=Chelativorans sp. ZYF759 TaxID=2692213 RepID=UPI00145CAA2E|nr:membrane protein insertase YidC [Chelativorans sp. ZYF759]NMG37634.1 membrane protein insertase YidC [Chelativorans sp. ZYF759]